MHSPEFSCSSSSLAFNLAFCWAMVILVGAAGAADFTLCCIVKQNNGKNSDLPGMARKMNNSLTN